MKYLIATLVFLIIVYFLFYRTEGYSMGALTQLVAKDQQDMYLTDANHTYPFYYPYPYYSFWYPYYNPVKPKKSMQLPYF